MNGTAASGWSSTVSLSPGPIIVLFYGADINSKNKLGDNPQVTLLYRTLVDEGYEVHTFAGRGTPLKILQDPVRDAENWLLSHLDTNKDGVYNTSNGDISRPIEIFGYSNGGIEISFLANAINGSSRFATKAISTAFAVDPVTDYMWGNGTVPGNVYHYYDFYQDNPASLGLVQPFTILDPVIDGIRVDSHAQINTYDDVYKDRNVYWNRNVIHVTILDGSVFYAALYALTHPYT